MRRCAMLKHTLQQMGLEEDRLRLVWASAAEGPQLAGAINQLVDDVKKLGPLDWQQNWEENGHRLEALQDTTFLEVSTPELADVVRVEDDYGRAKP